MYSMLLLGVLLGVTSLLIAAVTAMARGMGLLLWIPVHGVFRKIQGLPKAGYPRSRPSAPTDDLGKELFLLGLGAVMLLVFLGTSIYFSITTGVGG